MFPMRRNLVTVAGLPPGSPRCQPIGRCETRAASPARGQWWALGGAQLLSGPHTGQTWRSVLSRNTGDTVYTDNVKIIRVSFKSQHDGVKKYSVHNHSLLSVDTKYWWSSCESQWRLQWCSCQDWGWCQWMWCCGGQSEKVPFLLLRCSRFGFVR